MSSGTQYNDTGVLPLQASAALEKYRIVKLNTSTGKIEYAGAADTTAVGVTMREAFAADDYIAVWSFNKPGSVVCESTAAAITKGAPVYLAASGKVAASGTVAIGIANSSVGSSGGYLEVLLAANAAVTAVARAGIVQQDAQLYPIPVEALRVHDALGTNLPTTAASDDLGLVAGTFGTNNVVLRTVDFKNTNTTAYARFRYPLPVEYVAGETITLRLKGGMNTTVASSSCTVDAQVYRAAAPSTDICATAAQSINSLTAANKDFTITPTDCVPGDVLDIRIAIAGTDSATATAVIGEIDLGASGFLLDVKG